ncbi:MAG: acyl-CoA dehydrogenase family protein [Actinomycetota bacterium]|nr:acyl-CoA dehydrogenase family protein [Actinomycetota bacterium]
MGDVSIEIKDNRFMHELVGPGDRFMVGLIREFIEREIMPIRREMEASTRGDFELVREIQRKIVGLGFQGAFLPMEYGGWNLTSALTYSLVVEEFGRGEPACCAAPAGGAWAFRPACIARNDTVLRDFAPRFLSGEPYVACFAMTEPSGGCNIENVDMRGKGIHTRAVLDGDEWVINGAKVWPTNSGVSDVYCVVCNTDPSLGDEGIALIYVPVPIEGFSFGRFEDKVGFRSSREGDFYFDNVRVPREYRAGGPGLDAELLHDNLIFARLFSAAWAVGIAQGAFDEVLAFTNERRVAGKPIRQHTLAANVLADMAIGIQVGRDSYINAAYMFDHPETYGKRTGRHMLSRSTVAKVFCCDMAVKVTNQAMDLMGHYGCASAWHVEKYWRDNKIIQLWEGGAQLGRLDVARGYYDYDQFHPNQLYDGMRAMRGA